MGRENPFNTKVCKFYLIFTGRQWRPVRFSIGIRGKNSDFRQNEQSAMIFLAKWREFSQCDTVVFSGVLFIMTISCGWFRRQMVIVDVVFPFPIGG